MLRFVSVLLAFVVSASIFGADTIFPLDCEANARAKVAQALVNIKVRDDAYTSAVNFQINKWGLTSIDPATFGFLAEAKETNHINCTNGNNLITCTAGTFSIDDVGKTIHIQGAGVGGATLVTSISSFVNDMGVRIVDTPSTTILSTKTSKSGIAVWGYIPKIKMELEPRRSTDGKFYFTRGQDVTTYAGSFPGVTFNPGDPTFFSTAFGNTNSFAESILSNVAVAVDASSGSQKISLIGDRITGDTGVNLNRTPGTFGVNAIGNFIQTSGYGFLVNQNGHHSDIVIGSNNISGGADAVEFNGTTEQVTFNAVSGNVLRAGGGVGAGFGVGISKGYATGVTGNSIVATQQAVHIENGSQLTAVVGNTARANTLTFVSTGSGNLGDGPVVVGNSAAAGSSPGYGVHIVSDVNGCVSNSIINSNKMDGYSVGVMATSLDGVAGIVSGNAISNSPIAIQNQGGLLIGENLVSNCPTLYKSSYGNFYGKIYSTTHEDHIVDTTGHIHGSAECGAIIRGFYTISDTVSLVNGDNVFTLCDAPDYMRGRIRTKLIQNGSINFGYFSNDIKIASATVTQTDKFSDISGQFGWDGTLTISGGKLIATVFYAGTGPTPCVLHVDFDGEYYKH